MNQVLLRHGDSPLKIPVCTDSSQTNGSDMGEESDRGLGVGWCTFVMVGLERRGDMEFGLRIEGWGRKRNSLARGSCQAPRASDVLVNHSSSAEKQYDEDGEGQKKKEKDGEKKKRRQ